MKHSGFVAIDSLAGLIILGGVAGTFAIAINRAHLAGQQIDDSRLAGRLAEHALINLQHHQPMPVNSAETKIAIQPVNGGEAPEGFAWAQAIATVRGHHQSLIGIVPVDMLGEKP